MVDEIDQGRFKQATGAAMSFTAIDGIGEKTAQKIRRGTRAQAPADVADYNASTLAAEAGISESRAAKAIRGGGGNPNVDERGTSAGSVSAGGLPLRQGDFLPTNKAHGRAEAFHDDRPPAERRADEAKRAAITTDYEVWSANPGHFDFPGIDTPTSTPQTQPKDYKRGAEIRTTDPDEETEIATGSSQGEFFREIDGNRVPASVPLEQEPEDNTVDAPGLAPGDFRQEPDTPSRTLGSVPSSVRLPADVREGMAGGEEADMLFVQAEEDRRQEERESLFDF